MPEAKTRLLNMISNDNNDLTLSKSQARRFLLAHQGLWPPRRLQGKNGALSHIRRVGCIQFDPLNIVGFNPELILQARVSDFRPEMLQELLYHERKLLDGWDKMMAIYPVEDWPYFQRHREGARRKFGGDSRPATRIMPDIRKAIEERGPLSSIDLEFDQTVDWSWGPTRAARAALESMYSWGELVIHHKVHTRKVYDFARRHLPEHLLKAPDPNPTDELYQEWHTLRRIGGVGLLPHRSGDAWLGIASSKSKLRNAVLSRLLKRKKVIRVHIKGIEVPFYMRTEDSFRLERIGNSNHEPAQAAILAPLDNLLWDRRFIRELFDFDYVWEVYKPVAERRYGYYVLPILYGDRFVARFESGRDKESGYLFIKNWWWEEGVNQSDSLCAAIRSCFKAFLNYLDRPGLRIDRKAVKQSGVDWLIMGGE